MHISTKQYDCKLFKDKMVTCSCGLVADRAQGTEKFLVHALKRLLVYVLITQKYKQSISYKLLMCSGLVSGLKYM